MTLRKVILMAAILLSGPALAEEKLNPAECTYDKAPYFREVQADAIKKLAPQGLHFKQATEHHLLYASAYRPSKSSTVIDRVSGKTVATVGAEETAIVEDESGKLLGILVLDEGNGGSRKVQLHPPQGAPRWKDKAVIDGYGDSASVIVAGELLIIAHFHRIATGSSLTALELNTGAVRWKAEVQQLMIPHSKYWNDVRLSRSGNTLTLRGYEAGGCYLQTFDLQTGKRLSAQMHKPGF